MSILGLKLYQIAHVVAQKAEEFEHREQTSTTMSLCISYSSVIHTNMCIYIYIHIAIYPLVIQHSYGELQFIVSFPIQNGDFL